MAKPRVVSKVLATVALAATTRNNVQAFQPSRPTALSPPVTRHSPFGTSTPSAIRAAAGIRSHEHGRLASLGATPTGRIESRQPTPERSLFGVKRTRLALRRLRRSLAVLVASLAFLVASTRVHAPPAHASASAAATTSAPSLSQRLNPFRTRSADEMIDAYVRDRLFADDAYDPVESAYREACADYAPGGAGAAAGGKDGAVGEGATGAYPALLAEAAGSALGTKASVSSVLSSASSGAGGFGTVGASPGKNDGITAVLIKMSDFLQRRLRVSAGASYYILAGGGLFAIATFPPMLGVLYQGIQRLQIDKSEMKMYGKITDMDATSKKITDDDDDDDEEE